MYNSSLEKYLLNEIEKLRKEIQNRKNRHYVNQNIIEECREKIKEYQDKDDSVFSLLSPINIESSYKSKIEEENRKIEETNEENLLLISEIDECNNKIREIERQLSLQKENPVEIPDDYSPASQTQQNEEVMEDWDSFINKILEEIKVAENYCYSNPKYCKDKLAWLQNYICEMCYGKNE